MKASTRRDTTYFAAPDDSLTQQVVSTHSFKAASQPVADVVLESTVDSLEAIRLAGAQLDNAIISMAADVVEEEDAVPISLMVESHQLAGLLYQGETYRLIESVALNHRLQAFCLAQALSEQMTSYLITRSAERFAVWINVRALYDHRYRHRSPSVICPLP